MWSAATRVAALHILHSHLGTATIGHASQHDHERDRSLQHNRWHRHSSRKSVHSSQILGRFRTRALDCRAKGWEVMKTIRLLMLFLVTVPCFANDEAMNKAVAKRVYEEGLSRGIFEVPYTEDFVGHG